jgi:hypothetical protein
VSNYYKYSSVFLSGKFQGVFMESGYVRVADISEIPIGRMKKVVDSL